MLEKQEIGDLIREKYPFPISHAYGYLESRVAPEDRYQALLACFEVTLKTITAIAMANFIRDIQNDPELGNVHLFRELLNILGKPLSLGHWHQLLQYTLRPYALHPELHTIPELVTLYFRVTEGGKIKSQGQQAQVIQRFIQERNEDAHHRNRSQAAASQRLAELEPLTQQLTGFLSDLQFLAHYPLLYVEQAEHHDGQWHYNASYATGTAYPFRQRTWKTTLGINPRRCLLTNKAQSSVLELEPFIIVTSEGRLQQMDLFFFDGLFDPNVHFMSYHVGDYIDSSDDGSPSSVAGDALHSLIRLLENRIPQVVEEAELHTEEQLSAVDIYREAVRWAMEHGERQTISLEALRQILELPREEALQQERELEVERGVEVEPEEIEIPFEGQPSWANLAYYVLENSGKEEMFYKEIAAEAEELKDRYDSAWQKGDSANVAGTVSHTMSQDPRFYKLRRGYFRLTKNSELLSNPSWANLACFVLQQRDPQRKGMYLHDITKYAVELKEKYSGWSNTADKTPSNTVSATMSMDYRFESLPTRGYWRLAAGEIQPPKPKSKHAPAVVAASTTRAQAYEQVLAQLEKLGTITPLPFGRTYYALSETIHLMFRYSKAHQRSGEIEYFLGVTPQYYERIDDLGNGYMVFVLGQADNVLLVPTATFGEWVEGMEVSGSGTWPLGFYQSEDGKRLERWVPGAGREDITPFLNDYAGMQRVLAQSPKAKNANKSPRVADLLNAGLLKPGDTLYIRKAPNASATVVDAKRVKFRGKHWSYNDWGTYVTGWTAINIYRQVVLKRNGRTLAELRQELRQKL